MPHEYMSDLEENLKSRKPGKDDFFKEVWIDMDYNTKKKYLIVQRLYNDQKIAEREAEFKRKRKGLTDDYFVNLVDYSFEIKKNLCSTNYIIRSFYEYPQKPLKREIYERRKNSKVSKFSMEEMTHLFYNIVLAGKKLQEVGKTHGDISPFCIFHTNEGKFKLAPHPVEHMSPLKIQQEKNVKGEPLYVSPQMLFAVKKRKPKADLDPYKSDMFSLGLVLLEAGLLKPIGNIYSGSTINETALKQHVGEFEALYCDNPLLFSSIQRMLELNEEERADFVGLCTVIPPYKEICEYFYNVQHGLIDPNEEEDFDEGYDDMNPEGNNFDGGNHQGNEPMGFDNGGRFHQQFDEFGNPIYPNESGQHMQNPHQNPNFNQADEYNNMLDNHQRQEPMVHNQPPHGNNQQQFGHNNNSNKNFDNQNRSQGHQDQGNQRMNDHGRQQDYGYNDHDQQNNQGYNDHDQQNNQGYNDHNQQNNQGYNDHNQGYNDHDRQNNQGYNDHDRQNNNDRQNNQRYNDHDRQNNQGHNDHNQKSNQGYNDHDRQNNQGYNDHNQKSNQGYNDHDQQNNQGYNDHDQQNNQGYNDHDQQNNQGYNQQNNHNDFNNHDQDYSKESEPQYNQGPKYDQEHQKPSYVAPKSNYPPEPSHQKDNYQSEDPYGKTNDEYQDFFDNKESKNTYVPSYEKPEKRSESNYTYGQSTTASHTTPSNYTPSTYTNSSHKPHQTYSNPAPTYSQPSKYQNYNQPEQTKTSHTPSRGLDSQNGGIVVRNGKQYRQVRDTVSEMENGQMVTKTIIRLSPV